MSMPLKLTQALFLDMSLYDIEDHGTVDCLASKSNADVYSWITHGRENWLEKGIHICNVLGLVVLPRGLPETIQMADDGYEEGDEVEENDSF